MRPLHRLTECSNRSAGPLICSTFPNGNCVTLHARSASSWFTRSLTGGHLGPNLGVVELTIALHRIFDSPADPIIFDTGHQAYVHKMLTGRKDLRQAAQAGRAVGLSEPGRERARLGGVLACLGGALLRRRPGQGVRADQAAQARRRGGRRRRSHRRHVLGGAEQHRRRADRSVVVVVNDNGRSYSPTIGGLADRLVALRMQPAYEQALDATKRSCRGFRAWAGRRITAARVKAGIKDALSPQELFSDLGVKYLGPIDGHDTFALEAALRRAEGFRRSRRRARGDAEGPGLRPAEDHEADQMHSIGAHRSRDRCPAKAAGPAGPRCSPRS